MPSLCVGSETATEIRKYSKNLYANLEKETGLSTGFKPVGFIELACDEGRLIEYRRIAAINRKFGVEVDELSPAEVKKLFPPCETKDVLAGFMVKVKHAGPWGHVDWCLDAWTVG
jgi:glycine/D-amino acid oxidase-like deaminating enzyme